MRIPITLHTAQKKANDIAFLDCGATECFISQRFIDQHKLGVRLMETPRKLQNADGSPNAGGGLKHFTELEVVTGENPHLLRFYIADMGPDCYDLFPFLLIYFLFCLSLCTAPCLALFAFLCACIIAYLCVVLGHILHDT